MFVYVDGKKISAVPSDSLRDVKGRAGGSAASALRKIGARRGGPGWNLDHALPIRLLGIASGEKFELVSDVGARRKIRIALDVEGQRRVVGEYDLTAKFTDVVQMAQKELGLDLVSRKGGVLRVLNRTVGTGRDGWAAQLSELGAEGTAVMKLSWDEKSSEESMSLNATMSTQAKEAQLRAQSSEGVTDPAAKAEKTFGSRDDGAVQGNFEELQAGTAAEHVRKAPPGTINWNTTTSNDSNIPQQGVAPPKNAPESLPEPIDWDALKKAEQRRAEGTSRPQASGRSEQTIDWGPSAPSITPQSQAVKDKYRNDESDLPREVKLYFPLSQDISAANEIALPEDFFDVTEEDVARAQAAISRQARQMTGGGGGLMTKKMRDAEERQKMAKFTRVRLRLEFPDRSLLEATFRPHETIVDVHTVLDQFLSDVSRKHYYLFTSPPLKKMSKKSTETLWALNLVPAALLRIGSPDGLDPVTLTKEAADMREHFQEYGAPQDPPVNRVPLDTPMRATPKGHDLSVDGTGSASQPKKVPKWFRK